MPTLGFNFHLLYTRIAMTAMSTPNRTMTEEMRSSVSTRTGLPLRTLLRKYGSPRPRRMSKTLLPMALETKTVKIFQPLITSKLGVNVYNTELKIGNMNSSDL